jgi:4-amino-4-deoxy-L-arabinose transferase-like glycosyltransferase
LIENRGHLFDKRPARLILLAVICSAFVAIRCIQLSADPPLWIFASDGRELFAEPPAKSHEARNYALFGSFKLHEADNYQFWRVQSPVWVYPLTGFFQAFGVDYPQLRIFSTLYATLGCAVVLIVALRYVPLWAAAFVGATLALDPTYFHTARVGILEPAVSSWIALAILGLLLAKNNVHWLMLAHSAFVLAWFTKQAALYALPIVLWASYARLRTAARSESDRARLRIVLTHALTLVVSGGLYMALTDYGRSVEHNIDHVLFGGDELPQYRVHDLASVLRRLYDWERYANVLASVPISGPLALATVGGYALRAWRRKRLPCYEELVLLGWVACAFVAIAVSARSTLRFAAVVVPPAAIVAGLGLARAHAWSAARWPRRASAARVLPAVTLLAYCAYGQFSLLRSPQYSIRDAAVMIEARIGPREATIVGIASPGIVLGTPYRNFYVRRHFNSTRRQLAALGITHCLFRDRGDRSSRRIKAGFPELLGQLRTVASFQVRNEAFTLFARQSGSVAE